MGFRAVRRFAMILHGCKHQCALAVLSLDRISLEQPSDLCQDKLIASGEVHEGGGSDRRYPAGNRPGIFTAYNAESAVEPTSSENSAVSWRLSAAWCRAHKRGSRKGSFRNF